MGISLKHQNTKDCILEGLNDAQSKAVTYLQGPCMVLAGPGSGKTLTIARRIEYLLKVQKVLPEQILVITFTKYAAKEMKTRFLNLCGEPAARITCGTFHGIYYGILKWAYGLNRSNLLLENEKLDIVRSICMNVKLLDQMEEEEEKDIVLCVIDEIEQLKNKGVPLDQYVSVNFDAETFARLTESYEQMKKSQNKIDFEDMLIKCRDLFLKRPDYLEKWQKQFQYILIDEFQDINQVQYEVVKMLSLPENNLFIVGDDDQSIYGFRGADPGIMQQFIRDFPEAEQIILNINYRSTPEIVQGALKVIAHNTLRFSKNIEAFSQEHQELHIQKFKNPYEEADYLVKEMFRLKDKTDLGNVAVLFRTALDARILSEYLSEYQIPYRISEKIHNIYEHFAVRDLLGYLHLSQNEFKRSYFYRIMNKPNRYLSRDCVTGSEWSFDRVRMYYTEKSWMIERIDQLEWDLKRISDIPPYAAIEYIRKKIGYDSYIEQYAKQHGLKSMDIYTVLDEMQNLSNKFATIREWFVHIKKYEDSLKTSHTRSENASGVSLLTIHASKGLEFEHIYILQCNESTIPYKKAKIKEEIEEERRLFYVAMTRAKKYLTICNVEEKNGKELIPSRFLDELLEDQ